MTAAAETPGPWRAECDKDGPAWRVYAARDGGGDWLIARASRFAQPDESGEANAKLMAAAPALADALEALEDAHRNCASDQIVAELMWKARAALRLAGRLP